MEHADGSTEDSLGDDTAASDAELIARVRDGDRTAFGDLYGRHARAAAALARQMSVSGAEADDLVAESFARVLDTMLDGRGPDSAFRAYLFTTIRHTAYDRTRKDRRLHFTDDMTAHEVAEEADDPVLLQMENSFVAKAFTSLPERWQTILWHTQVEGQTPAEVGVLLGMTANAVTSLAFRAREGLREAYLQVHMAETIAERCRATIDKLGAYTRGGLSKRETAVVEAHLAECDRCPALAAELSEINSGLRGLLAPLLLGSAAAGYIATLPAVVPLTQIGAAVVGGGAGGGALGGKLLLLSKIGSSATRASAVTGGAIAAAVATVVAVVIAFAANGTSTNDPLTALPTVTTATTIGAGPGGGSGGPGTAGAGAGASDAPPTDNASTDVSTDAPTTDTSVPEPSSEETTSLPSNTPTSTTDASVPEIPGAIASPSITPTSSLPSTTTVTSTPTTTGPTTTGPTTTGPTTTEPTTTEPTTPPPPSPVVTIAATQPGSLVAGGTAALTLQIGNDAAAGPQAASTLQLTAGDGVQLLGATIGAQGFRGTGVALREDAPAAGELECFAGSCLLPELAPGDAVTIAVTVGVAPQATDLAMTWSLYGQSLTGESLPVTSGYTDVMIAPTDPTAPVVAGTNVGLSITTTTADGVTDPGPIRVPRELSPTVMINSTPLGCIAADTYFSCEDPTGDGIAVDAVVLPTAEDDLPLTVVDAGGRSVTTSVPLSVVPLDLTRGISMTGPFSATSVGADAMYCSIQNAFSRGDCGAGNTGMLMRGVGVGAESAAERTVAIGGGEIVYAELTWARTGPSAATTESVTMTVNGVPTAVGTGELASRKIPTTGSIASYAVDVTALITGDSAISVTGFTASTKAVGGATPFAAWSLTVIWVDPSLPDVTVGYRNRSIASTSTSSGASTPLFTSVSGLQSLTATIWGADPWADKKLTIGTTVVAQSGTGDNRDTVLNGQRTGPDGTGRYQNGFDQLAVVLPGEPFSGSVKFTNRVSPTSRNTTGVDGLWIGPVLALSAPTVIG